MFVKGDLYLPFAINMGKSIGRNISKNLVVNTVRNFFIMVNNLLQMNIELLQKEQFKKQQRQLVI